MSDDPTVRILEAIAQVRTELGAEIARLRTELGAEIAQLRGDMMDRMDRLQNAITQVRDDITVNYANNERVERVARSGADETRALAEVVTAMERQIRRLSARVDGLEGTA